MPGKFLLTLVITVLSPIGLYSLSFEQTAYSILYGSADYRAGEFSLKATEENLKTENNLPDPQLDGEFLAAPAGETDRWGAELSWGLEWPGVYGARKKEAEMKLMAAKKRMEMNRAEQLTTIKILLLDYVLASQKKKVFQDIISRNDSIFEFAEKAAKSGEITVIDLNKVKLENANVMAAMSGVLADCEDALAALSKEYGADCRQIVSQMECEFPDLDLPSDKDISEIVKSSAEMEMAVSDVLIAKESKKVVSRQSLPSISLGYKHAFEDGTHFNGATLGISLPIFSTHNRRKAADADIAEAEIRKDAVEEGLEAQFSASLKKLRIMKEQITMIEPVLKDTDHMALLLKAYENGLISMIDYLTECNYFTNANLELLSLKHAAAVSLAELQKFFYLSDSDKSGPETVFTE